MYREQTAGLRCANSCAHMHVDKLRSPTKLPSKLTTSSAFIFKSKIRIEYIGSSYVIISESIIARTYAAYLQNRKSHVISRLVYLQLILAHSKGQDQGQGQGQGQGHAHFDCVVRDCANIAFANKYKVARGLSVAIFTFDLGHFKGQGQDHAHFDCRYRANDDNWGKHCYWQQAVARGLSTVRFTFDLPTF